MPVKYLSPCKASKGRRKAMMFEQVGRWVYIPPPPRPKCDYIKIYADGPKTVMPFSRKHPGKTIQEVWEIDPTYIDWACEQGLISVDRSQLKNRGSRVRPLTLQDVMPVGKYAGMNLRAYIENFPEHASWWSHRLTFSEEVLIYIEVKLLEYNEYAALVGESYHQARGW
jgi:uncharacterized protein (DUF3820 family)